MDEKQYYHLSSEASLDLGSPVMRELLKEAQGKKKILDLGCGDGSRLSVLPKTGQRVGIDNNEFAIRKGKKRYEEIEFIKADIEKLPFKDESFDFIYSAFVLEHVDCPEPVIKEAIRVLEKNGTLFLACPNFGAPNRRSPCSRENKYLKLIKGFFNDLLLLFGKTGLGWKKVRPRLEEPYQIDFDTTNEPYLLSLTYYLRELKMNTKNTSSLWEIGEGNNSLAFYLMRKLGTMGISPFKYWGPQLLLVAQKT